MYLSNNWLLGGTKKDNVLLSILMRKCFNIISLCGARPGDEWEEEEWSTSPVPPSGKVIVTTARPGYSVSPWGPYQLSDMPISNFLHVRRGGELKLASHDCVRLIKKLWNWDTLNQNAESAFLISSYTLSNIKRASMPSPSVTPEIVAHRLAKMLCIGGTPPETLSSFVITLV